MEEDQFKSASAEELHEEMLRLFEEKYRKKGEDIKEVLLPLIHQVYEK